MKQNISRRLFLGSSIATLCTPAFGGAPLGSIRPIGRGAPSKAVPTQSLLRRAALPGRVSFALWDVDANKMVDSLNEHTPIAPASVTKAITASYALNTLGPDHRFSTRLLTTGGIVGGVLQGDLILQGSGDPTLNTDRLGVLVEKLRTLGIWKVAGRFILDANALPILRQIDPSQPPQVGYNPAVSGLNLNYNRVRFDWKKEGQTYLMTMRAAGKRYEPDAVISRIAASDTITQTYQYDLQAGGEEWLVRKSALGAGGGRWLPTRLPVLYTGEAFRGIARVLQISIPDPVISDAPTDSIEIAQSFSVSLRDIVRDMLKYSTNLTAEVLGLSASGARDLPRSAAALTAWSNTQGITGKFVDHSGLGAQSQITTAGLAQFMAMQPRDRLKPLLKNMSNDRDGMPRAHGAVIKAKTGTLNFVSALSGYLTVGGREFTFGILTDDLNARSKILPEDRENPDGAGYWNRKSRGLQYSLLKNWALSIQAHR